MSHCTKKCRTCGSRDNFCCCNRWRNSPIASWVSCLDRTAWSGRHRINSCPPVNSYMVKGSGATAITPSSPQFSKKREHSSRLRAHRGWRRVNWRRFQFERAQKAQRKRRGCKGGLDKSPCLPGPLAAPCGVAASVPFWPPAWRSCRSRGSTLKADLGLYSVLSTNAYTSEQKREAASVASSVDSEPCDWE